MKICPKCGAQAEDSALFCTGCGAHLGAPEGKQTQGQGSAQGQANTQSQANAQGQANAQSQANAQGQANAYPQPQYAPQPGVYSYPYAPNPYDHTAEFDPKDISENKVFAMLGYLLGTIGVIICLLASHSSPYARFHVRQSLKFTVSNILMAICAVILCWTLIVPIAAAVMYIVFFVIRIICFFQICCGKAKEPVIIRSLGFLK